MLFVVTQKENKYIVARKFERTHLEFQFLLFNFFIKYIFKFTGYFLLIAKLWSRTLKSIEFFWTK